MHMDAHADGDGRIYQVAEGSQVVINNDFILPVDPVVVRCTLPKDLSIFTGRIRELNQLRQLLQGGITDGRAVAISAIGGMGGVGKTTLAIHIAHQLVTAYADHQLHVDLRGFDPADRTPADPKVVLQDFLLMLGVARAQIPDSLEGRSALFRDRMSRTQSVIILDNAINEAQIRPLLPMDARTAVIITSRRRMGGLDEVHQLDLDVFSENEALELLAKIVGRSRVFAEEAAARRICRLCGYLGIAISIAGYRLKSKAQRSLRAYAARLEDERSRLDELAAGDRAVAAVLSLSYNPMSVAEKRVFRLIALHPGSHFTASSIAALASLETGETERILETLSDQYMIQGNEDAYTMHDLLRAYAHKKLREVESLEEQNSTLSELLAWYSDVAFLAHQCIARSPSASCDPDKQPGIAFGDYDTAFAWLSRERVNLTSAARAAAATGQYEIALRLAESLTHFFHLSKSWDEWIAVQRIAVESSKKSQNWPKYGGAMNSLGLAYKDLGKYDEALLCLNHCLEIRRTIHDRWGVAQSLNNIGITYRNLGMHAESLPIFIEALEIFDSLKDVYGSANTINNMGISYEYLGNYELSLEYHKKSLSLRESIGDRYGVGASLNNIGDIYRVSGQPELALPYLLRALGTRRAVGHAWGIARTLNNLGHVYLSLERHEEAKAAWSEALQIFGDLADAQYSEVRTQLERLK
ncbi:tetratricopeptide repeat protein [Microbispora sp. H10885]|uniref:tetratricopeptide repeat protein n=1 Tax=Microbispora sp. H10885 TaxID=2729110 RepID=UPI0028733A18|nr:tetratricopeptide repeat protein [Microbispora sp. H10885]